MENKEDEQSTATMRSKLSFSSTTSILSAEEQLEGDGPLTPTDKMEDDVEDDDDDDDLSALNSILQAGSPGSLSDEEEEEEDDLPTEHDSASSLSSVPDDFPLSPEIPPTTTTDELETNSKKRRKEDDNEQRPLKKVKSEQEEQESIIEQLEEPEPEPSKKRRVSRTPLDIPETPRTTRRKSRQEEETLKEQQQKQADSPKPEEIPAEDIIETKEEPETEPDHEGQDNNQDYQQRHKEALDALTHIEIEFARLRDKMYQEKMSELNEEAIMIANGTHPELVSLMAEIEEKKGKRVHSAEAWRRHQHANFKQQFEGFEYQANIHFISQKNALRRTLLDSINGRKWSIEDERTKLSDPSKGTSELLNGREIVVRKKETKEETNELQDIKEILGFPMAPNPSGLSVQDVDDDLKLLGL